MTVLVDTSVWIEFFNRPSCQNADLLEKLLSQDLVVICQPIRAELLSGCFDAKSRPVIERTLLNLPSVDLSWSSEAVWQKIIDLAKECQKEKLKIQGIIDRMIVLAAEQAKTALWTLDNALKKLAMMRNCHFSG